MIFGSEPEPVDLSETVKQQLKATFDIFDDKQLGYIEAARVITLIRAVGETPTQAKMNHIAKAVSDAGGQFTLHDLQHVVATLRADPDNRRPSVNEVEAAFRVFDPAGNGYITKDELTKVLTTFGDVLSKKEVDDLLADADADEQGRIDYVRFSSKLVN